MAFKNFVESLPTPPTVALSLHGYGRSVLYPFSCKSLGANLSLSENEHFQKGVKWLLKNNYLLYTTGQSWAVPGLYTVNGDAVDYLYSVLHVPAFSVEV